MNSLKLFWHLLTGQHEQITEMNGYYVIQYLKQIGYTPKKVKHGISGH